MIVAGFLVFHLSPVEIFRKKKGVAQVVVVGRVAPVKKDGVFEIAFGAREVVLLEALRALLVVMLGGRTAPAHNENNKEKKN